MTLWKQVGQNDVPRAAVGLALALAFFVAHHGTLFVQAGLVDGAEQMPHAVGFHPQRQVERRLGHGLKVVGAIGAGGAVHPRGADLVKGLEILVVVVFRAAEHQMFEQMGKARPAGALVLGAHVVPEVDGHDGGLGVPVHDDPQAVVQGELAIGNIHRRSQHAAGDQRHGGQRPPADVTVKTHEILLPARA